MEVRVERRGQTLLAAAEGRIDSGTAREFENSMKAAIDAGDRAVILNMSQLSYISSAGLRAILVVAKGLWQRDCAFALCALPDPIRDVVEIAGFDKIFQLHASEAEALGALGS